MGKRKQATGNRFQALGVRKYGNKGNKGNRGNMVNGKKENGKWNNSNYYLPSQNKKIQLMIFRPPFSACPVKSECSEDISSGLSILYISRTLIPYILITLKT